MRAIPGISQFLCDHCKKKMLLHKLAHIHGNYKVCPDCYPSMLTETERSLLIWFHNNLKSVTLDQGAILHAYGKITGDPYDEKDKFLPTLTSLIEKGLITTERPPLDCFYMITLKGVRYLTDNRDDDTQLLKKNNLISTQLNNSLYKITKEGIEFIETSIETTLIFQCDRCGDIYSPDIEDPMLLHVYLAEHPEGHVSVESCESCENEAELADRLLNTSDAVDDDDEEFWKEIADAFIPDDEEQ